MTGPRRVGDTPPGGPVQAFYALKGAVDELIGLLDRSAAAFEAQALSRTTAT